MTQRIFTNQVFSNTGIIGAGFKINFFETGTTTPKNTFSDVALTTANSNPIIADSNGRFIDVFVSEIRLYKSVLTDANDNVLKTLDPVDPNISSIEDFNPRPLSFWGLTTGDADNYILAANPAISANSNTHIFAVGIHIDCNASCDLTIDSQSTKDLKKYDGAGSKIDLVAGDLQANQRYFITDDGVDYVVLSGVPASQTAPGIAEIATQTEVNTGTDNARIVTPLTLTNLPKSGFLKSVQTFSSSGTWNKPSGINVVMVEVMAGGGGGGGGSGSGAAGSGGTGGTSSFGSFCSASGGGGSTGGGVGGGSAVGAGGIGGIGTGGTINFQGGYGHTGAFGAGGGSSFFGGGGKFNSGSVIIGGGGGAGGSGSNARGGGGGGGGYAKELILSGLGASEIITVGTGGTAGIGNGGGTGGGTGGGGLVIVYEYT